MTGYLSDLSGGTNWGQGVVGKTAGLAPMRGPLQRPSGLVLSPSGSWSLPIGRLLGSHLAPSVAHSLPPGPVVLTCRELHSFQRQQLLLVFELWL